MTDLRSEVGWISVQHQVSVVFAYCRMLDDVKLVGLGTYHVCSDSLMILSAIQSLKSLFGPSRELRSRLILPCFRIALSVDFVAVNDLDAGVEPSEDGRRLDTSSWNRVHSLEYSSITRLKASPATVDDVEGVGVSKDRCKSDIQR